MVDVLISQDRSISRDKVVLKSISTFSTHTIQLVSYHSCRRDLIRFPSARNWPSHSNRLQTVRGVDRSDNEQVDGVQFVAFH